jgi:hypothetical protein
MWLEFMRSEIKLNVEKYILRRKHVTYFQS